jgi:S-adenosylmethionine:tRNA ribosyltransferase-isomerase
VAVTPNPSSTEASQGRTHPAGPPSEVTMDDYEYDLPEAAIAQEPVQPRSAARLLVAPELSPSGGIEDWTVADLPRLLRPGDVLAVNDTRVLAARLDLVKASGGAAEVLLLEPIDVGRSTWEALVRPGRRLPPGTLLAEPGGQGPVVEVGERIEGPVGSGPGAGGPGDRGDRGDGSGRRSVRLLDPAVIDRAGSMPLPPYIHRRLEDQERYQTVYSATREPGDRSTAAPTAGLHFTAGLLDACRAAGAAVVRVDLAIGLDTFRPVTARTPAEHVIHSERYSVPAETMEACRTADRVVAVGTTTVRALESAATTGRLSGRTDLYIHGDHTFRVVDVLVTNFHLPRSSLLLMVEAFCGPGWRRLYGEALARGFRFLSFGDAMVVARTGAKGAPVEAADPAGGVAG